MVYNGPKKLSQKLNVRTKVLDLFELVKSKAEVNKYVLVNSNYKPDEIFWYVLQNFTTVNFGIPQNWLILILVFLERYLVRCRINNL